MKRLNFAYFAAPLVMSSNYLLKQMALLATVVICAPLMISLLAQAAPGEDNKGAATDSLAAYILGPDDQIVVRALEAEEISDKPVRVDASGYVPLPMIGRVRAAGLTVEELEKGISAKLQAYLHTPQVSVSVLEFRSQPVSVIGEVNTPGVHQLQGRKTLVEILSLAGGLKPSAGPQVKITRPLQSGRIPLPQTDLDPTGKYSVAAVLLKDIVEARRPQENILIQPYDVISVPRARMVYVVGEVGKPGGFVVDGQEAITVLKALSLAQGLGKSASSKNAKVIHPASKEASAIESSSPIELNKILQGKLPDVPLQPEDILFVPSSAPKKAATRAIEAFIQAGTGIAIYRP